MEAVEDEQQNRSDVVSVLKEKQRSLSQEVIDLKDNLSRRSEQVAGIFETLVDKFEQLAREHDLLRREHDLLLERVERLENRPTREEFSLPPAHVSEKP